jgi:glycine/D-amino acid oxidase-like deaminating enzyme
MEAGAVAGAEEAAAEGGVHVFTEEEGWDVLEDILNGSAAALILLEHHWAVPLRDAVARAGASASATASSARSTWWHSAWSRRRRRGSRTSWKRRRPQEARHDHMSARRPGGLRCSEHAE